MTLTQLKINLFNEEEDYRVDEIVRVTKYKYRYVYEVLRNSGINYTTIGTAKKNNKRYLGKDLNKLFPRNA